MKQNDEYNRLDAIEVVIEERKIALQPVSADWRTKVFKNLEELPEELPAAFTGPSDAEPLPIGNLVRRCYQQGLSETAVEAPYYIARGRLRQTILRSLRVKLSYKQNGLDAKHRNTAPPLSGSAASS